MTKQEYQPIKTKRTTKIIPPSTGSNVQMKKDGYTWEDLDKAWWEGFDTAKDKMQKRIAELEAQIEKMKCCKNCNHFKIDNGGLYPINVCELTYPSRCKNFDKWEIKDNE